MASMKDPLVKQVHALLEESSVPEVVEALLVIARYYKRAMKKAGDQEYNGWEHIESALSETLAKID